MYATTQMKKYDPKNITLSKKVFCFLFTFVANHGLLFMAFFFVLYDANFVSLY